MDNPQPELHSMLLKQLKRFSLSKEDIAPEKQVQWNDFLKQISHYLFDCEKEHYLTEQSMETSSREMIALNQKLELAQRIARLGYWMYNKATETVTWTTGSFHLAGIETTEHEHSFSKVVEMVHPNDKEKLVYLMNQALSEGKDYELELRLKNRNGKYYWQYVKGHPHSILDADELADDQSRQFVSGIIMDINERKISEEKLQNMHHKLIKVARESGMAEVTTSVLHNIGNILNSACTSNSILSEKLQQPYLKKLFSVSEIIKKHLSLQDDYLTHHPKGKKIPDYLIALIEALIEESEETAEEIKNIDMHLNHIKEIVILQNEFSGISGLKEKFLLSDVIDLSIQMSSTKKIIHIIKDYKYDEPMMTDKSKLLQIIINLFRNAKDSVILSTQDNKNITISTTKINNNTVEIRIIDNGLGIPKENLTKIFSFGYTTKRNGHGFGLHSSAIAAKELGGSLSVESNGAGTGAVFILKLPIAKDATTQDVLKRKHQANSIGS